jgi:hypothetical protein
MWVRMIRGSGEGWENAFDTLGSETMKCRTFMERDVRNGERCMYFV